MNATDLTRERIFVEIPSQMPANVYRSSYEKLFGLCDVDDYSFDIIDRADRLEDMHDLCEDEPNDDYEAAKAILDEHGKVIVIVTPAGEECYPPSEYDSQIVEFVDCVIGGDLNSFQNFDTVEEAIGFYKLHKGHQFYKVLAELETLAECEAN